jgi:hypothetical protein
VTSVSQPHRSDQFAPKVFILFKGFSIPYWKQERLGYVPRNLESSEREHICFEENCLEKKVSMVQSREQYLEMLNNLLDVGSTGELLQVRHVPHMNWLRTEASHSAALCTKQERKRSAGVYMLA